MRPRPSNYSVLFSMYTQHAGENFVVCGGGEMYWKLVEGVKSGRLLRPHQTQHAGRNHITRHARGAGEGNAEGCLNRRGLVAVSVGSCR